MSDQDSDRPKNDRKETAEDRAARLARALRANLAKRKRQSRLRRESPTDADEDPADGNP